MATSVQAGDCEGFVQCYNLGNQSVREKRYQVALKYYNQAQVYAGYGQQGYAPAAMVIPYLALDQMCNAYRSLNIARKWVDGTSVKSMERALQRAEFAYQQVRSTQTISAAELRCMLQDTSRMVRRLQRPSPECRGTDEKGINVTPNSNCVRKIPSIDLKVNFKFNSAKPDHQGLVQIKALSQALASNDLSGLNIVLTGHTDRRGSDDYNQRLSEQRAEAVKAMLVAWQPALGQQLHAVGVGEQQPISTGNEELDHTINRRVSVMLMHK